MPQADPDLALTALTAWWRAMGVAVDEAAIRALTRPAPSPQAGVAGAARPAGPSIDARIAAAAAAAAAAPDLAALKAAIEAFDASPLRAGAQNTVVFDGVPGAPVMVVGEGPGGEEDRQGLPFVGPAGQLLDRMLAAIDLSRRDNALITNVNYWRPPRNRNPEADELAVCRPFVLRMIELAAPRLIIAAGSVSAKALLGTQSGIMRLRGQEKSMTTPSGRRVPVIAILHPAYLLRRPQDKALAWADLQAIARRLEQSG